MQGVEEAKSRLSFLAQNKKLWSQQMFLDVGEVDIHLRDIQSEVRGDDVWPAGGKDKTRQEFLCFYICMYNNFNSDLPLQDELEKYSFKSIYRCDAVNSDRHFPSLLMLICQSEEQKKPDILFFNCEMVKVSNDTWADSQHFTG